jgi:putative DNA methylase
MAYRKKLIEVSLPLEAVNEEASRQKNIRDGHPSTLHLYWSRKPLATCRAVLFSSLVDDPSEYVTGEASILEERERLFKIIEKLVIWENSNDESILNQAKIEIARSIARELNLEMPIGKIAIEEFLLKYAPPLLDPFAGGGSIPLEAQRLGLRVFASDLNPMSVLINKAMIEFPRYCKDKNPLHPISAINQQFSFIKKEWKLAEGLAEDIRYYGTWMGGEAQKRIGHYYPKVNLPVENGGTQAEVIAWIWARSVQCPNPACKIQMPLANSFYISQKKKIWVKPEVDEVTRNVTYHIKTGEIAIPGSVTRQGAICVGCGTPVPFDYIRNEGVSKGLFQVPIAIVAQGKNGRIYLPPTEETKFIIDNIPDSDFLDEIEITDISGYINPPIYGYNTLGKWFTKRQKKTLETFTALIG